MKILDDGAIVPDQSQVGTAKFHLAQLAFVKATSKITVAQAGIRGGKTHAGAFKSIVHALENPTEDDEFHLVCSPTYPMSKVPIEKLFRLLYDKTLFPVNPLVKYYKADRVFVLASRGGKSNVSRLRALSMHDPDRARGIKAKSAWLDEGAYMEKYAWEVIQGRLADSDGPAWITTTPAGYNWVYELYEEALAEKREGIPVQARTVRFIHWTSFQNTFIPQTGFTRLAGQYDSRTADQEIRGLFIKMAGLVYSQFTRATHVRHWRLDRAKPVFVGQDFNVSKMASSFAQEPTPTSLHTFHERLQPDSDTYELARYLDRWCSENNYPKANIIIYPDASGAARSTSGKSDTRILKEAGYQVRYAKRNPFVKDRINCLNGLMRADIQPRYFVDPTCTHHIETYEKQMWDTDKDPPAPDKTMGFDHIADASGYVAWARQPLRIQAGTGYTQHQQMRKAA